MQQSTLKKLSEVLGISISTVSRALKDHPDISQSTKAKVKELAERKKTDAVCNYQVIESSYSPRLQRGFLRSAFIMQ